MSATNRGAKRAERDAYATPTWCTEAITREIMWTPDSWVLEPCAGDMAIVNIIRPIVGVVEICEIAEPWCIDFMEYRPERRYDFIITNPPYSLSQEFVTKSLELANCVIMLLPLSFLASQKRKEWWQSRKPTAIHVLTKRPSFTGKGTDSTEYAWFVWDSTGRQKVGWHWI